MSDASPEMVRVDSLWRSLQSNDEYWVKVKSWEGGFNDYVGHGEYSQPAYMLYADGRQMAFDLSNLIGLVSIPEECPSYTSYVERLEGFIEKNSPEYEESYKWHVEFVERRCREQGAPKVWEVGLALRLWEEQMRILRSLPALAGLFRNSSTYRAENNILPQSMQNQNISITAHPGASVQNSSILGGDGNKIFFADQIQSARSKEELLANLREVGVPVEKVTELSDAIDQDESSTEGSGIGWRVKAWLGDLALWSNSQGIQLANGVTSSLIATWIQGFYQGK
jgi:hypothetical protein